MSIGDKTFELVHNHLRALEYTGEVGLSCDDTKLTESTRLYWDAAEKCHYLVGAVGGPIRVLDPEKVQAILDDPATIISKKVRNLFTFLSTPSDFILAGSVMVPTDPLA